MCHELAHCVHEHHNKAFYKLMGELQREHARVAKRVRDGNNERHRRRRVNKKGQVIRDRKKGRRLGDPIKGKGLFDWRGRRF